jgi:3-methyl-2-oxobutanoate hydroxymethyltransferase
LFMEDICGENAEAPKHAKSFGNIYKLREMIKEERIKSLKEFRKSSLDEKFPSDKETAKINDREFELFMEKLDT